MVSDVPPVIDPLRGSTVLIANGGGGTPTARRRAPTTGEQMTTPRRRMQAVPTFLVTAPHDSGLRGSCPRGLTELSFGIGPRGRHRIWSIGSSWPTVRTCCGWPTSPTLRRGPAFCISPSCSMLGVARSSVGQERRFFHQSGHGRKRGPLFLREPNQLCGALPRPSAG